MDAVKELLPKKLEKKEEKILAFNPPTAWIKDRILDAGTSIGNVHFIKKSDGKSRKMCYKLHVKSPSTAKVPIGISSINAIPVSKEICTICTREKDHGCSVGPFKKVTFVVPATKSKVNRKAIDEANNNITVLDCNAVVRDEQGKIKGRGAWKSIPLNNITRIKVKGKEIIINKY